MSKMTNLKFLNDPVHGTPSSYQPTGWVRRMALAIVPRTATAVAIPGTFVY